MEKIAVNILAGCNTSYWAARMIEHTWCTGDVLESYLQKWLGGEGGEDVPC